MTQYINKDDLVKEIKERIETYNKGYANGDDRRADALEVLLQDIDTLETKDPYEQCVQYSSVKDGIKAHAETYSFNIESQLFNQLTKEQQLLWRKEIEQAVISGGDAGVELARDIRYADKKVDLEKALSDLDREIKDFVTSDEFEKDSVIAGHYWAIAKHAFLLGLKAQKENGL